MQIGKINAIQKNFEQGKNDMEEALKVAKETDDPNTYNEAKCCFGYIQGQINFKDHFKSILKNANFEDNDN